MHLRLNAGQYLTYEHRVDDDCIFRRRRRHWIISILQFFNAIGVLGVYTYGVLMQR